MNKLRLRALLTAFVALLALSIAAPLPASAEGCQVDGSAKVDFAGTITLWRCSGMPGSNGRLMFYGTVTGGAGDYAYLIYRSSGAVVVGSGAQIPSGGRSADTPLYYGNSGELLACGRWGTVVKCI